VRIISITDICDFQGGSQPPKNEWSTEQLEGYVRMLQIRDFTQSERTTPEYVKKNNRLKTCKKDDILIGRYGASVGKILTGLTGAYNVAIIKSIPNEKNIIKPFLYHVFKGPTFQNFIINVGGRAAQAGFNKEDLKNFKIHLPPLDDQKRIAHLLGKVEGMIARRKQHLQQLDELLKSVFLEMFGIQSGEYKQGKIDILANYSEIVSGVTKGKRYKEDESLVEAPYMRVANVQDGHFILDEIKTILVSKSEYERYLLKIGDILLTEGGDPDKLGRGAVWEKQIPDCIHQNHIFRVRIKNVNELNPYYLSGLIGSIYGKSYFLKSAKQTTGIASINSTQLKNFPVIIPSIELQNQFASIMKKVESLKIKYQESLSELENLYGSLSQKAFKGELDLSRVPLGENEVREEESSESSHIDEQTELITKTLKDLNNFNQINLGFKSLYDVINENGPSLKVARELAEQAAFWKNPADELKNMSSFARVLQEYAEQPNLSPLQLLKLKSSIITAENLAQSASKIDLFQLEQHKKLLESAKSSFLQMKESIERLNLNNKSINTSLNDHNEINHQFYSSIPDYNSGKQTYYENMGRNSFEEEDEPKRIFTRYDILEILDENLSQLETIDLASYERIIGLILELLKDGKIEQIFDEKDKCIKLKAVK